VGLGHRPGPNAWNMKEGEQTRLSGLDASGMQGHTVARIVVEKDRKTQIGVEQPYEAVEREVQVWRNLCSSLVEAFEGLLAMKFVWMNDEHVGRRAAQESVVQPHREAAPCRRVLGRNVVLSGHLAEPRPLNRSDAS